MQRISFDHLIGASHHRWWEGEAECFGCLDVYNQLELNALLDGRVARELGPSVKMISCYEAGYDGLQIPSDAGQTFRRDAGHDSNVKPDAIPT